ncbi:septation protein A [Hahella sp. SMD15-11]|uniref:Inner membrane-spanning protein YciB n=1 Tax=Thermohahella caldifontis TaxID=3142973 RepID=A0AB39UZU6_9GAMM
MKLFFDFFPIVLFFVVFKMTGDILAATAVLIPATLLQVGITWWKFRKLEVLHLVTLFFVVVLGGLTLIFHDPTFIKWKPTVVFWLLALAFMISQFLPGKNFYQRMMESSIQLPERAWTHLNTSWVLFNTAMGGANLYVAYTYPMDTWVNFKLFGILGCTVAFVLLQTLYIARHLPDQDAASHSSSEDH